MVAEVVSSSCPEYVGLRGEVIDETKNLLVLRTDRGVKKVPKKDCTFRFILPSGESVIVPGKLIAFRPEERTKKAWKHRFEVGIAKN